MMRKIGNCIALCPFCMEEHNVSRMVEREKAVFKNEEIIFDSESYYCEECGECFEDENLIKENDIRLKDAYREKMGLLKSSDIVAIRNIYGISQSDLCRILDWGGKTITRYESHQIQDKAHDMILRKISEDPGWYIDILVESQKAIPEQTYNRYYAKALSLYTKSEDYYLRKCIEANCSEYANNPQFVGNASLSINKIIDVIKYYASSREVTSLYKSKLMELMWYSDFLSYRERNHSITGLPYMVLPSGIMPEGHDYLIKLKDVPCEDVIVDGNEAYYFHADESDYYSLTDDDKSILDTIISVMGAWGKEKLINQLEKERAYKETKMKNIVLYDYAKDLQIAP